VLSFIREDSNEYEETKEISGISNPNRTKSKDLDKFKETDREIS
jgi:hypothetical protein